MKRTNYRNLVLIIAALAFALGLAGSTTLLAQTGSASSVTGHVKDPQGASLPGATVTLHPRDRTSSLTTNTDGSGAYHFDNLAAGEYLIEATAQGFASAGAQQVTAERGKATTLDISLELSGVRNTVVVTASDTPQSVDEVSKAISVVEKHDIEDRDESMIAESLRN